MHTNTTRLLRDVGHDVCSFARVVHEIHPSDARFEQSVDEDQVATRANLDGGYFVRAK